MDLIPDQIARLESLLNAGFHFVTLERVERHVGVEKGGFVALLDPSNGELRLFGQAGFRIGEGIGMLVERGEGKAFVWHGEFVAATPELLETYDQFKRQLSELLGPAREQKAVGSLP